jgi:hypothetical protein
MNYTPSNRNRLFPAISNPNVFAKVTIDANGNLIPQIETGGTNAFLSCDRITFVPSDILATSVAPFQNGWVNSYSGATSYYVDPSGVLHLEGVLNGGSLSTIFTLPSGYFNTDYKSLFLVISNEAIGRIDIDTTGNVVAVQGSSIWLSLDGICFPIGATWTNATYNNGWTSYGQGYAPAGYWKSPDGVVHLRGLVMGGGVGGGGANRLDSDLAIFTLPSGYRPDKGLVIPVISNGAIGRLDISTDGTVVATSGNNTWLSLDGISFTAFGAAVYFPAIAASYQNNWSAYNDYWTSAGYYRHGPQYIVRVRGMIKGGTNAMAAFVIKNAYTDPSLYTNMEDYSIDVNDTMNDLNLVRQVRSLPVASFTPPVPIVGETKIDNQHILDLRNATVGIVNYSAAQGSTSADPNWFTEDNLPDPTFILSKHLLQVRQVVDDAIAGARCFDCSSACGVSCSASCITGGCTGGCSTVCGTSCGGTCWNACSNTCSVGCTGNCSANCTGSCGIKCTGSCASTCGTTCGSACAGGCSSGCAWSNCQTGCSNGDGCENTCHRDCNGWLVPTGCNGGCQSACSGGCGGGCYSACQVGCGGACNGGCTSCTNNCSGACSGVCANGCATACSGQCSGVCSSSTCTNQCGSAGCTFACSQSCSGNACSTNCSTTCQAACYTTCNSSCSTGCTNSARIGNDASGKS